MKYLEKCPQCGAVHWQGHKTTRYADYTMRYRQCLECDCRVETRQPNNEPEHFVRIVEKHPSLGKREKHESIGLRNLAAQMQAAQDAPVQEKPKIRLYSSRSGQLIQEVEPMSEDEILNALRNFFG